jgi:hypothetical protein
MAPVLGWRSPFFTFIDYINVSLYQWIHEWRLCWVGVYPLLPFIDGVIILMHP